MFLFQCQSFIWKTYERKTNTGKCATLIDCNFSKIVIIFLLRILGLVMDRTIADGLTSVLVWFVLALVAKIVCDKEILALTNNRMVTIYVLMLIRSACIFWSFKLNFQSFHSNLKTIHSLYSCLSTCRIVKRHKT